MKQLIFILTGILCYSTALAQGPPAHYGGNRVHNKGGDTSQVLQKPEKGPNHGRMLMHNGIKVEIVTPSNAKKPEVNYFVFDSLNNPVNAKQFTGTVKYVFGSANQYLEANMIPSGKPNQYFTSLEDWRDCKHMIVTLKENGKMRATMMFMNIDAPPPKTTDSGDHHHQGRQNGNGMNPGGGMINGGGMNGGGMNNGGMYR